MDREKKFFFVFLIIFFTSYKLVFSACVVSTTPLAFGVYDPTNQSHTNSIATITVSCSVAGAPYTISLDKGITTGGSILGGRLMQSAGLETLTYNLYTENTYTTLWGDGVEGSTVAGTATLADTNYNHTVYGQIPAAQDEIPGSYSDTITITVTY